MEISRFLEKVCIIFETVLRDSFIFSAIVSNESEFYMIIKAKAKAMERELRAKSSDNG